MVKPITAFLENTGCILVEGYTINPCELAMSNYDNPLVFKDDSNTVLELKCTTQVPLWMVDMIRVFNLDRGSFSKYASSSLELLGLETFHRFDRERHF